MVGVFTERLPIWAARPAAVELLGGATSSSSASASRMLRALSTLVRRYSALNKHIARSFLLRLNSISVTSAAFAGAVLYRAGSRLVTAMSNRSFSVPGAMEPVGDAVRGGVFIEGVNETGVEGCSGAEAVAASVLGSSSVELD